MDQIVLNHVTKQFTTKTLGTVTAVNDFNLTIKEGECFSFLGPSGCGKTTTLRMIAGFEDLSDGEIHLCGRPVSIKSKNLYVPPEERGLGMVFQSFAVWPHMNIFENVAFPLRVRKVPKAEMIERVKMALKHTSLDGMEKVYPGNLSGGQQQRIALARHCHQSEGHAAGRAAFQPDPKLRETMRFEIKELQSIQLHDHLVTHDQSKPALPDRMMVMDMRNIFESVRRRASIARQSALCISSSVSPPSPTWSFRTARLKLRAIWMSRRPLPENGERNGHGEPSEPNRHLPLTDTKPRLKSIFLTNYTEIWFA
ncbi:MAG: ABC transporter ATP-binding protein [Christensenellales bacterium]